MWARYSAFEERVQRWQRSEPQSGCLEDRRVLSGTQLLSAAVPASAALLWSPCSPGCAVARLWSPYTRGERPATQSRAPCYERGVDNYKSGHRRWPLFSSVLFSSGAL